MYILTTSCTSLILPTCRTFVNKLVSSIGQFRKGTLVQYILYSAVYYGSWSKALEFTTKFRLFCQFFDGILRSKLKTLTHRNLASGSPIFRIPTWLLQWFTTLIVILLEAITDWCLGHYDNCCVIEFIGRHYITSLYIASAVKFIQIQLDLRSGTWDQSSEPSDLPPNRRDLSSKQRDPSLKSDPKLFLCYYIWHFDLSLVFVVCYLILFSSYIFLTINGQNTLCFTRAM